jgi:hypothetical protein
MECQEATESMPTHHAIHEDPAHGIFIFRFWNALKLKKTYVLIYSCLYLWMWRL